MDDLGENITPTTSPSSSTSPTSPTTPPSSPSTSPTSPSSSTTDCSSKLPPPRPPPPKNFSTYPIKPSPLLPPQYQPPASPHLQTTPSPPHPTSLPLQVASPNKPFVLGTTTHPTTTASSIMAAYCDTNDLPHIPKHSSSSPSAQTSYSTTSTTSNSTFYSITSTSNQSNPLSPTIPNNPPCTKSSTATTSITPSTSNSTFYIQTTGKNESEVTGGGVKTVAKVDKEDGKDDFSILKRGTSGCIDGDSLKNGQNKDLNPFKNDSTILKEDHEDGDFESVIRPDSSDVLIENTHLTQSVVVKPSLSREDSKGEADLKVKNNNNDEKDTKFKITNSFSFKSKFNDIKNAFSNMLPKAAVDIKKASVPPKGNKDGGDGEEVSHLSFQHCCLYKNDTTSSPCLLVATNHGSVILLSIKNSPLHSSTHPPTTPPSPTPTSPPTSPSTQEEGFIHSPILSSTGTTFQLKGPLIHSFLLHSFTNTLLPPPSIHHKDLLKEASGRSLGDVTQTHPLFLVLTSQLQIKVISLPTHTCIHNHKSNQTLLTAMHTSLKGQPLLITSSTNHITAFSLPHLTPSFSIPIPSHDISLLSFSTHAQGIRLTSPSQLSKLALVSPPDESSTEGSRSVLYIETETPQVVKTGFFQNLFDPPSKLDRDALFGEGGSGRGVRGVATVQQKTTSASSEMHQAKLAALERGEKLGELEERTGRMALSAEVFGGMAGQLKKKYKEKKWYQF